MKHVLPLKEKEIEQRRLEAEARKVQRMKDAEGDAEARKIETAAEADSRRKLSDADAYRIEVTGKARRAQMARDSALIAKNPLLIQKTLADKLSRQDPGDRRAAGRRAASSRAACSARRPRGQVAAAVDTPHRGAAPMTTGASNVTAALPSCWSRWSRTIPRSCATRPATTRPRRRRCGAGTGWRCGARRPGFLEVYDHRHERPGYIRPTHRARPPARRGQRARAARRSSASCATRAAASRWASGTRRCACARRRPAPTRARSWRRSGRWRDRLARRASAVRADARDAALAGAHRGRGELRREVQVRRRRGDGQRGRRGRPAGAPLLRRRGVGARAGAPAAPRRSSGRGRRCSWRARACQDRTTLPLAPTEARAWNDRRAPGAAVDRVSGRERAVAGAARDACACGAPRRRLAGLRRGPPRQRSSRPRAPRRRPSASSRSPIAACSRPRTSTSTTRSRSAWRRRAGRPRRRAEAGRQARRRRRVRAARRGRDLRARRPDGGAGEDARPLGERCTYGVVWQSALRWAPSGSVATIAVQPLAAWTELWVAAARRPTAPGRSRRSRPATADPDNAVGYVEAAGFSPDGGAPAGGARGARRRPARPRRFQVVEAATLAVEKWAAHADKLGAFKRWSAAVVARRNAGAAMNAATLRWALVLAIVAAVGAQLVFD